MPLYLLTVAPETTTESQRLQIAKKITRIHVDVTGAPPEFVNTYFSESPDLENGFQALPDERSVLIMGNIRDGRSDQAKRMLVDQIRQAVVQTLHCNPSEVEIRLRSVPASRGMEGGRILPEPGSPEEAAWSLQGHDG